MNNSTLIIGGTTASGKTTLAINLVCKLKHTYNIDAEIINADSVQVYHDLKILTAYPTNEELDKAHHNLFGILSPYDSLSVTSWLELAKTEIKRLNNANKIAIVCGGTGFYIQALLNGIAKIPSIPKEFREQVQNYFNEIGRDMFFEELYKIDPISAQKLNKNDTQRILRAYEVASYTGKSLSEWWKQKNTNYSENIIDTIVLLPEKEKVKERARIRLLKMINSGAIEEVQKFNEKYENYTGALREVIGYREICDFLRSNDTLKYEKMMENMRVRTNQYIKRQSTWFRNQLKNATFIQNFGNESSIVNKVLRIILSSADQK